MSSISDLNKTINPINNNDSTGLRRSKRRNKFHLDVAAMLTGNNPDRRLSPLRSKFEVSNNVYKESKKKLRGPRPKMKKTSITPKRQTKSSISISIDKDIDINFIDFSPKCDKMINSGEEINLSLDDDLQVPLSPPQLTRADSLTPAPIEDVKKQDSYNNTLLLDIEKQNNIKINGTKDATFLQCNSIDDCLKKTLRPGDHDYVNNLSSSLTTESTSRKRKSTDPDFLKAIKNDSDQEDLDEVIFRSAKIEYTNVNGSKSSDEYFCPKCPAQFESKVGLTNHLKLHGAQKQFPCDMCDFSCTNKKTMRQHRRIHGVIKRSIKKALQVNAENNKKSTVLTSDELSFKKIEKATTQQIPFVKMLEKSPGSLADMEPKIRAIDLALKLNLDEHGNPKPIPTRVTVPLQIDTFINDMPTLSPSVNLPTTSKTELDLLKICKNVDTEKFDKNAVALSSKNEKFENKPINKVKCTFCPFGARSLKRLEPHMLGHTRTTGYNCPLCTFKTKSLGFLKRHCNLHGAPIYKWPPEYVGTPHEELETLLAQERSRLEKEQQKEMRDAEDIALDLAISNAFTILKTNKKQKNIKDFDLIQKTTKETQSNLLDSNNKQNVVLVSKKTTKIKKLKINSSKLKRNIEKLKCKNCDFKCKGTSQFFCRKLICHQLKTHKNVYPIKSLCQSNQSICLKCGVLLASLGKLRLHLIVHHPPAKADKKIFKRLLKERISAFKENSLNEIKEKNEEYLNFVNDLENEKIDDLFLNESLKKNSVSNLINTTDLNNQLNLNNQKTDSSIKNSLKTFTCKYCPFTCIQIVRLNRHENKHYVKADHQCTKCTFSCRSTKILTQHMRLHSEFTSIEKANENCLLINNIISNTKSNVPQSSLSNTCNEIDSTNFLTSYRKGDLLSCNECPYKSKHGCDMKAHLKMHQFPKRIYSCLICSYSTMRLNALKSHELLHNGIQPQHIREEQKRMYQKENDYNNTFHQNLKNAVFLRTIRNSEKKVIGEKLKLANNGKIFYRCRFCGFQYNFYGDLFQHARHHFIEEETNFTCKYCNFKTNLENRFDEHIVIHLQENVSNATTECQETQQTAGFKCNECPFYCDTYGKLWHHIQKHKKISRFTCTKCTFSAGSFQCLSEHVILHARDLPEYSSIVKKKTKTLTPTKDSLKIIKKTSEKGLTLFAKNKISRESNSNERTQNTENSDVKPIIESNSKKTLDFAKLAKIAMEAPLTSLEEIDIAYARLIKETRSLTPSTNTSSSGVSWRQTDRLQCKDCPFECTNKILYTLHLEMHVNAHRPFKCNVCTYNCFSAEAMHAHLSLHAPLLSPASTQQLRKRRYAGLAGASNGMSKSDSISANTTKRLTVALNAANNTGYNEIPITNTTNVLQCTQCNYRTVYNDEFLVHRMEHVQLLQQRLSTTIKRAQAAANSNDGEFSSRSKVRRPLRRIDRMLTCPKCAFRCDTAPAFSRHLEFHNTKYAPFRCALCNYGAQTQNIVFFHEQNHHLEGPMTTLFKHVDMIRFKEEHNKQAAKKIKIKKQKNSGILRKKLLKERCNYDTNSIKIDNDNLTNQKFFCLKAGMYRCGRCDFIFYEVRELDKHWEEKHANVENATNRDREIGEMLKLNIAPCGAMSIVV